LAGFFNIDGAMPGASERRDPMHEDDDRVLAIMMKAPRQGCVKTRLATVYSAEQILTLYRALVEDTIDLARVMGVRTVAICPADDGPALSMWLPRDVAVLAQRGEGLGAGLRSTFELLCAPSLRRVIAFNADSPHLPASALESAFAALATDDLVVGPCDDGGYYLVGAKRPHPGLFETNALGRDSACATLLAEAARQGLRLRLGAQHYDIDLPDDVMKLARELSAEPSRAFRTAAILATWGLDDRRA
jgi:rSAM/selenodomain-associated transferase 1